MRFSNGNATNNDTDSNYSAPMISFAVAEFLHGHTCSLCLEEVVYKQVHRILCVMIAGLINGAAAEMVDGQATEGNLPSYLLSREVPSELQQLESRGEFTAAEKWIADKLPHSDAETKRSLTNELERLRRLRREFSVTAEDLLRKLTREIPDATLADIEKWRKLKAIQWINVDGKPLFFRREPGNLLRFNDEAKQRARDAKKLNDSSKADDPASRSSRRFNYDNHITSAVLAAKDSGATEVLNVKFHVKHTATLKPGIVPPGEIVRCWFPYPQAYRQQKEPSFIASSPAGARISMPGSAMRTLYLEQPTAGADQPTTFAVEYEYENAAFVPDLTKPVTGVQAAEPEDLQERIPHLKLSPSVRKLAAEIVGTEKDPLKKAKLIWSHLDSNIKWCAEIEYSTLTDIVEKVMTERRGDCGTQALMFTALCRASGVPARWQSGWVTKPGAWNMHDWAEFHVDSHGWLPADPSVGSRESDDPVVRDFLFGHVDAYRMVANLEYGTQFDPPMQHLRSDPVDNQRGEMEWKDGNLYYDQWDYEVTVDGVVTEY